MNYVSNSWNIHNNFGKKYKVLHNKQLHRIQEEYFRLIFELANYPIYVGSILYDR